MHFDKENNKWKKVYMNGLFEGREGDLKEQILKNKGILNKINF